MFGRRSSPRGDTGYRSDNNPNSYADRDTNRDCKTFANSYDDIRSDSHGEIIADTNSSAYTHSDLHASTTADTSSSAQARRNANTFTRGCNSGSVGFNPLGRRRS